MPATGLLRDLIRANTTNPPGNETPAVELLRAELDGAGLETKILASEEGRPNLVASIPGPRDRPALVLLSHTDVVGVEADSWSHNPFGGETADGALWGRGALDMKGIAAMHIAAVVNLVRSGVSVSREVIFCAVADEETGGALGAEWLLAEHPNAVGFEDGRPPPEVLGEGAFGLSGILDRDVMPIVLGEKQALWIDLIARGEPGHGSMPPASQAPVNLAEVLARVSGFGTPRVHPVMREQFQCLASVASGPRKAIFSGLASRSASVVARALHKPLRSSRTVASLLADTITPTTLSAGYKHNVVPGEARASLDCRLLPDTDPERFLAGLRKKAARRGVDVQKRALHDGPVTGSGPLYDVLARASVALSEDPIVVPSLTTGMTDLRYFRRAGAAGYGWVPLVLSPELLATIHGHDERIPIDAFERGVEAMSEVVRRAAS
ncbi:MAG: M20/M25/M40 family metallo-hydrolase [Actinomycetota bacterium]|nr:M20/M25/M40 family metallo-hydrolase [Actinomycetota bacterium]